MSELWTELCATPQPNAYVETLNSSVTYLETGPLKRYLRLNEVIRVAPRSSVTGVSISGGRGTRVCTHRKGRANEHTARRWPSARQGERPPEKAGCAGSSVLGCQPPELWGSKFQLFKKEKKNYKIRFTSEKPHVNI